MNFNYFKQKSINFFKHFSYFFKKDQVELRSWKDLEDLYKPTPLIKKDKINTSDKYKKFIKNWKENTEKRDAELTSTTESIDLPKGSTYKIKTFFENLIWGQSITKRKNYKENPIKEKTKKEKYYILSELKPIIRTFDRKNFTYWSFSLAAQPTILLLKIKEYLEKHGHIRVVSNRFYQYFLYHWVNLPYEKLWRNWRTEHMIKNWDLNIRAPWHKHIKLNIDVLSNEDKERKNKFNLLAFPNKVNDKKVVKIDENQDLYMAGNTRSKLNLKKDAIKHLNLETNFGEKYPFHNPLGRNWMDMYDTNENFFYNFLNKLFKKEYNQYQFTNKNQLKNSLYKRLTLSKVFLAIYSIFKVNLKNKSIKKLFI